MTPKKKSTLLKNPPSDSSEKQSGSEEIIAKKPHSSSDTDPPSPTALGLAVIPINSIMPASSKKLTPKKSEAKSKTKRPTKRMKFDDKAGQAIEDTRSSENRLFSKDDEVKILEGVLYFKINKGSDAYTDTEPFYEFVREDLSVGVTKNQLMDKARKLRRKYRVLLAEKSVNGVDPAFITPSELKCFQIWKETCGADDSTKRPAEDMASPKDDAEGVPFPDGGDKGDKEDFFSMFPQFENENTKHSVPESVMSFMKKMVPRIGRERVKEFEVRWKDLQAEESRVYLKRLDLVREQIREALTAMETKIP